MKNPMLLVDNYKLDHYRMYPKGMSLLYSNFTPRKSRNADIDYVVVCSIQKFIKKYLIEAFDKHFFYTKEREEYYTEAWNLNEPSFYKKKVLDQYRKHVKIDSYKHIEDLWDLGYLPIEIKALPEGTKCPIGVPVLTIKNTHKDFGWLVNYLETLISCQLWQPITTATIADQYKKNIDDWAIKTTGFKDGTEWFGHDFSMRGISSVESSILSGMAHLLAFNGTDVVPAIYDMEEYYNEDFVDAGGVPATEHSVMTFSIIDIEEQLKNGELNHLIEEFNSHDPNNQTTNFKLIAEYEVFKQVLRQYPTGILSIVSDSFDFFSVLTEILPRLKDEILARDGKLVIRPDSGNPPDIICGLPTYSNNEEKRVEYKINSFPGLANEEYNSNNPLHKGALEILWDIFGGTINEQGYKVLDPHIGLIYGDGIGLHNLDEINSRIAAKGFATTNWVAGFGSYGYQYNTRDTFGFAMKATYGEITQEDGSVKAREIYKDPITDDGTKRSAKGLLQVIKDDNGKIVLKDKQTWEQESGGLLQKVFCDGIIYNETSYTEIKERMKND